MSEPAEDGGPLVGEASHGMGHPPEPTAQDVPDDILRQELAELLRDGLLHVAGTLAILAVLYGLAHRYLLEPTVPTWVFTGFLAAAAFYSGVLVVGSRWEIPARWAHPVAMGLAVVIVTNLLTLGVVRQEPWVSTDFMLFLLAQGLVILDRRWLVPMVGMTLAAWGAVVWVSPPDPLWLRYGYWILASVFIAGVLNVVRRRSVVRAVTIQHVLERKNAELARLRDEAEAAERAKTALLANTSHEIRTPMNAIIGMTSLLAEEDLQPSARDLLNTITTSSEHLLLVINDLLDMSKLEAGRLELEAIPFVLSECIEDVVALTGPRAEQKGLDLTVEIEDDVPSAILGDPTRLRQILVNLVSNAIKFTEQGSVRLTVRSVSENEGIHQLRFEVKDTGIGIPRENQRALFRPFSQIDASTTRRYGGTGLGLSIVQRLVRMMGGMVGLESTEGEGSTFWFTLPAQAVPDPEPLPWHVQPSILRGKQVLVVDDNATNREILERQLGGWTLHAVTVASAREALERLEAGPLPDLVIADYQMPEMDGVELARRIRERHSADELPIVMLSSGIPDRDAIESGGLELQGFLTKPPRPSSLYETIVQALGGVDTGRPTVAKETDADGSKLADDYPLSILVAEDSEINQRVIERMLEHLGYQPTCVSNGKAAVEATKTRDFDVVLMDVQMPVMDGVEATQQIRKHKDPGAGPRIVALTAHALVGDRERLLSEGMDDYLPKPVDLLTLSNVLRRIHAAVDGDDIGTDG